MDNENSLILLKLFHSPFEANIIRAKLEENSIDCFILDTHMMNALDAAVNGVRVMVRKQDYDRAKAIMEKQYQETDRQTQ